jgi:hypothetical protein
MMQALLGGQLESVEQEVQRPVVEIEQAPPAQYPVQQSAAVAHGPSGWLQAHAPFTQLLLAQVLPHALQLFGSV